MIGGRGTLYAGTSGFAYPAWVPLFYPSGSRASDLLTLYGARLNAVELNNTFYQQPKPDRIAAWLAATPPSFRFVVKAQRGGSLRALGAAATETVAWLTGPYRLFGERLGSVLYRVPEQIVRDDERLGALLRAWPVDMPLTVELQHPTWHVDEVFELLAAHGATLCATDLDEHDPPDLRLTGGLIYVRLRRTIYSAADVAEWAARLSAFLTAGTDCYAFFRHDADGTSPLRAELLGQLVGALTATT